mmetsp:Transcript_22155/g.63532  ORF Transcript_22155/g.63532 Transcript_22155/m.63532 type:complete len:213 (-) Transcript_22155:46-684(-)
MHHVRRQVGPVGNFIVSGDYDEHNVESDDDEAEKAEEPPVNNPRQDAITPRLLQAVQPTQEAEHPLGQLSHVGAGASEVLAREGPLTPHVRLGLRVGLWLLQHRMEGLRIVGRRFAYAPFPSRRDVHVRILSSRGLNEPREDVTLDDVAMSPGLRDRRRCLRTEFCDEIMEKLVLFAPVLVGKLQKAAVRFMQCVLEAPDGHGQAPFPLERS